LAHDVFTKTRQLLYRVLKCLSFFIALTAHDPLSRFDPLLRALQGYSKLPGSKTVYIYVDKAHEQDVPELYELI